MDAILERDVDLVVHSGDVFDSVRPATHVIIGFLKQTFRITREDIPYLVAAGNHETPRLRSTTAALEYANLVNAISAHGFNLDYELVEIGNVGVGVTLVPHGAVFGTGAVTPSRGADVNVLVTHGMVPGLEARQHEMGEANLQAGMIEGGFDYVALGHILGLLLIDLGHQVGGLAATSGADLNAVRTIQMIGTSVKNDIAMRAA